MKPAPLHRASSLTLAAAAIALLAAGAAVAGRPIIHWVVRQAATVNARQAWTDWKKSPGRTAPAALGNPALWLTIPACKINTLVVHLDDAETLHYFPALDRRPNGSTVILAHRDIHFRPLARVSHGDTIRIERADGSSERWVVRSARVVLPEDVARITDDPESSGQLHLLTCYPIRYTGPAPKRFLVTATPASPEGRSRVR